MQAIKKDILESAGLVFFTLLSKSSEVPGLWAAQGLLGWVREAKPPPLLPPPPAPPELSYE